MLARLPTHGLHAGTSELSLLALNGHVRLYFVLVYH